MTSHIPPITEDDIAEFLQRTPGFFERHAEVLASVQITSPHGAHLLALGRRKWRSQGGYPTLTHGGLSLLEVLSPWVELTR